MARRISILTTTGRGGESLSYPLFEDGDEVDDTLISSIAEQLEEIGCVDAGIFPADIVWQGDTYIRRQQKPDAANLWFITLDGLMGNHIFIAEGKSLAQKILCSVILQWGKCPYRWTTENSLENIMERVKNVTY